MARKRILLYAHDGLGMGHLRRMSRIAEKLAEQFSTLILSGMRESAWIVPQSSGLIKLPDWDGLSQTRAERVGKQPWVDLKSAEALTFRSASIVEAARHYQPDVLIVDYLPMGQRRELLPLLETVKCPRYLVHRGVADTSDSYVLRGEATMEIAAYYDRILIASDARLGDVAASDDYCAEARSITRYAGFVAAPPQPLVAGHDRYIVCSAGGGFDAEDMMLACLSIAARNPAIPFHIVLGPRSRLNVAEIAAPPNCDVRQYREDLADLHRDAAVVVSAGGYNSVLEAAFGGARVIVHPNWTGDDDEQARFADLLSDFHPVSRLEALDQLETTLLSHWAESADRDRAPLALERNGDEVIAGIIAEDLQTGYRSPHLRLPQSRAVNLDGFRDQAEARLDRQIFEYIDGGAGDETTRRANHRAFGAVELVPSVFRNVASTDTQWSSAIGNFAAPIGISPTALHRLVHADGEVATARAAQAVNVPMIVSMMASCSIEEIAEQSGHPSLWLQTYILKDRGIWLELVRRAEAAGYTAIVVTAGCPVVGKRDRNLVNGFTLPPHIVPANFERMSNVDHNNPIHSFAGAELDAGATWHDLAAMAASTRLPVFVKGILSPLDVGPALDSGAAAIMVSNHGGRQLDGTTSSLKALAEVGQEVAGTVPLFVDGGIRRGTDVAKAIALGADAAFIGSAALWALAVDGEKGVARALDILGDEYANALALLGCADSSALRREASTILRVPENMKLRATSAG